MRVGDDCRREDACITAHLLRRSGRCQGGVQLPLSFSSSDIIKNLKGIQYKRARLIPFNLDISANVSVTAGSDNEVRERIVPKANGSRDYFFTEDNTYALSVTAHGGASVNLGLPQHEGSRGRGRKAREFSFVTGGNSEIPLEAHGSVDISVQREVKTRNGKFLSTKLFGSGKVDVRISSLGCTGTLIAQEDGLYWKWSYFDFLERREKETEHRFLVAKANTPRLLAGSLPDNTVFSDEYIDDDLILSAWNVRKVDCSTLSGYFACREYIEEKKIRKGIFFRSLGGVEVRISDTQHDVTCFETVVFGNGNASLFYLASTPDFSGDTENIFASYAQQRIYRIDFDGDGWNSPVALMSDALSAEAGLAVAINKITGNAIIAFKSTNALNNQSNIDCSRIMALLDDGRHESKPVEVSLVNGVVPSLSPYFIGATPYIAYVIATDDSDDKLSRSFYDDANKNWVSVSGGVDINYVVTQKELTKQQSRGITALSSVASLALKGDSSCGGNCGRKCYCNCRDGEHKRKNGCACKITCSCKGLCLPGECVCWKKTKTSKKPTSYDPNEMAGPVGVGEMRYVKPGCWMDYTIYFENQTNATAAAQDVYVTLPKDAGLDWSTFELGEVVFGGNIDTTLSGSYEGESNYALPGTNWNVRTTVEHTVDAVVWHLRIVDPSTPDNYPLDAYAGFLPPNDETGRGEGHLRYRVRLKENIEVGSIVRASAVIEFDPLNGNAPIETDPAWWNTVAKTVDVDCGEGLILDDLVVGLPFGELSNPEPRVGYVFEGWYTGKNGTGTRVTADTIVTAGMTSLYAHWTQIMHTVIVDGVATNVAYGTELMFTAPESFIDDKCTTQLVYVGTSFYQPTTNEFSIVVTNNIEFTWDILATNYWLNIDKPLQGAITGATNGWYLANTVIDLSAVEDTGYSFNEWTGDVSGCTELGAVLSVLMNKPRSIGASFGAEGYTITYSNTKDAENLNPVSYTIEDEIIFEPLSDVDGWKFTGWQPASISRGSTGDVTVIAQWSEIKPELGKGDYRVAGDKLDGTVPEMAASVYDGYLYLDNVVMGTIQAKVSKPKLNKKSGITTAKTSVAIQVTGEKKITLKGELDLNIGEFTAADKKSGRVLILKFGSKGISGSFDKYDIDGARNLFDSKDKSEKSTAEETLKPYLGAYSMICDGGILSVTIAKKGKVTIKGAIDGNKVSAKAQALIGADMICIPVVYSKKSVNLAFTIWLPINGGNAEIVGLDDEAIIGKAGTLKDGVKFIIDGDIAASIETEDSRTLELLPNGETITASGSKWLVAGGVKAAKVSYKGDLIVTPGKKGEEIANTSGLKLSYKAKDGSFKGSFTVYAIVKGKLKKHKATVEGVLVNGIGHGSITIKKIGTWAVTIE